MEKKIDLEQLMKEHPEYASMSMEELNAVVGGAAAGGIIRFRCRECGYVLKTNEGGPALRCPKCGGMCDMIVVDE